MNSGEGLEVGNGLMPGFSGLDKRVLLTKVGGMLILASGSPRRKLLLEEQSVAFRIVTADIEEENHHDEPVHLVKTNALLKADWVAERNPEAWVLGSDTTVSVDDEILNKPVDLADARRMLLKLGGRAHEVYTGVALVNREQGVSEVLVVRSRVVFKPLDDATIDGYFKVVNPLDKAGAYGIQEGKEIIIDHFEGSFSNIMGLPVDETLELLSKYGV